jgi:predicted peptidase
MTSPRLCWPVRIERDIPTSAFTVAATINNLTANRTVVDVYTNNAPELDRRGPRGTPGRYLIIELSPDDPDAGALVFSGGINNRSRWSALTRSHRTPTWSTTGGRVRLRPLPFAISNQGVINPIVDDFLSLSYTDSAGRRMNLRLFQPQARVERRRDGFPLVVFLHGGGERGANNITQITANQGAVAFVKPERQDSDPSYVLAPQVPVGSSWTTPAIQAALLELIDQVASSFPIDEDRLSHGTVPRRDRRLRHPSQVPGPVCRRPAHRGEGRPEPDTAHARRAGVGDPLDRRSRGGLHNRDARPDERARRGGRSGHARPEAGQPVRAGG